MGVIAGTIKPYAIVEWGGKEISRSLAPFVESLTYTDVLDSKNLGTDTVSLTLANNDGRFYDKWYPRKGDTLKCGIGWTTTDGRSGKWMWGTFTIDQTTFKGSPDKVSIGANAKPVKRGKIENIKSQTYTDVSFSDLITRAAKETGVKAIFDKTMPDIKYQRVQQRQESKQQMISRLASDAGIPVAFKSNRIVAGHFTSGSTLAIDLRNRSTVQSFNLPDSDRSKYTAVKIRGFDPIENESFEYTEGASDDDSKVQTLTLDTVNSIDEARSYAKSHMNGTGKGKQGASGRLVLLNTTASTADVIELKNAGQLPPRWKPTTISTSLTSTGWTTTLTIEKQS